jgi:hypothetical protein
VSINRALLQATSLTLARLLPLPIEMVETWKNASAKDQTGMGQPMDRRTEIRPATTEDVMDLELLLE